MQKNNKTQTKSNRYRNVNIIQAAAVSGLIAIIFAFIIRSYPDISIWLQLLMLSMVLVTIMIGHFFHSFIHQIGHLVFGLLTGYRVMMFRVGNIVFYQIHQKWQITINNNYHNFFDCWMAYDDYKDGEYPFRLQLLGGNLLNVLFIILAAILIVNGQSYFFNLALTSTVIGGLILVIRNSLFQKLTREISDITLLSDINKDKTTKKHYWIAMSATSQMMEGVRPKDFDFATIDFLDSKYDNLSDYPLDNRMQTFTYLIKYYYYLDNNDFKKATDILNNLLTNIDRLPSSLALEVILEHVYILSIQGQDASLEWNENNMLYFHKTEHLLSRSRIKMAFECYQENHLAAMTHYYRLEEKSKKYFIKGLGEMEHALADNLKNELEQHY